MEPRIVKPDWFLVTTYVGLIAVALLSVWITLISLATASGIYENLEPTERHAGTPLAIISLFGGLRRWSHYSDSSVQAVVGRR
jgi:hypothetical protein